MQNQTMELAPSYVVLQSVECVIDETTLNIHPMIPNGEIDQTVKFNLLEAPNVFFDALSEYDFLCIEKIVEQEC